MAWRNLRGKLADMIPADELILEAGHLPPLERLRQIMHRLRAPGGCPWDAEQTHESLIPHLIEESHEVIDTIRRSDDAHLQEELGDLLLQVVFHAELAQERSAFDLDAVATGIADKLVRRHPHVFGQAQAQDSAGVLRQWEQIKQREKGAEAAPRPWLHGAGQGLPALLAAEKIQKKAAKVGFDWPEAAAVLDKVREELAEVQAELQATFVSADASASSARSPSTPSTPSEAPNSAALREELGDLLFTVVNLVRHCGENPEDCLTQANAKFVQRFGVMEQTLSEQGLSLGTADLDQMEAAWQQAKSAPTNRE